VKLHDKLIFTKEKKRTLASEMFIDNTTPIDMEQAKEFYQIQDNKIIIWGEQTSFAAELMAIEYAINNTPINIDIIIISEGK